MNGDDGLFWGFIVFLVILHLALRVSLGLGEAAPDLLTVAVLLGARRTRPAIAAGVGFGLGLLRDSLALGPFGGAAAVLTVLGYLGSRTRDFVEGESLLFTAVYLFIGVWLHDAAYAVLSGDVLAGGLGSLLIAGAAVAAAYAAGAGALLLLGYRLTLGAR